MKKKHTRRINKAKTKVVANQIDATFIFIIGFVGEPRYNGCQEKEIIIDMRGTTFQICQNLS